MTAGRYVRPLALDMRLESVQIGKTMTFGTPGAANPLERPWTSAIRKEPVD